MTIGTVEVAFFAADAQGVLSQIGALQTIPSLAPEAEATVSTDWQTTGLTGRHTLSVIVDPLDKIDEISETNNTAQRAVVITVGGTPIVSVVTDRTSYAPTGTVHISVETTNPGPAEDFVLDLVIEDAQGFEVTTLLQQPLAGFGYASRTFTASWPATGILSGAYRVHAMITRPNGERFDATAPFTIMLDQKATAKVTTDRTSYLVGEPVQITGLVQNTSANADLTDLVTLTQVLDFQGTERFRAEGNLGTLFLGTHVQVPSRWPAGGPGNYTVRFTVQSAGAAIASSTTGFNVVGVVKLEGRVQVAPPLVPVGTGFALLAEAANTGTLDATQVTLRLLLIDPDPQTLLRAFERVVDLPAGGAVPWEVATTSLGLALKTYTVLLQAQGSPLQTLASGTLSVVDQQAPVVQIADECRHALVSHRGHVLDRRRHGAAAGVDARQVGNAR